MWLTQLSITRPVTILMLVLALVIMGLQARERMPVDLMPSMDIPMLVISTVYAGTGPEEIERLITKPVEDAVSSISGLKKISSTSAEGVSSIRLEFVIGTNTDTVAADVRSKIDVLRATLPQDSKAPQVIKIDVNAQPVINLNVVSGSMSPVELRRMADDVIKDRLSQLPGVATVTVTGGGVREIRVEVDKNRLEAYGLSIIQVVNALKARNLNLPSGTIDENSRTAAVRVMGEFTAPSDIRTVRIPNAAGNPNLCIGDVAAVTDTVAKTTNYTRVDQSASVLLKVQKQSGGNTVKVVDGVRKELERLTGKPYLEESVKAGKTNEKGGVLPADVGIEVAMDQSTEIRNTLHDVYKSLIEGALLAVLIVFMFLHSIRSTFIVALAIPTSMIGTFLVMGAMGFTINMMSMLALSLSVGILVDDSIVVLENIHRHLAMGESPRDAAINGRTEIGQAALAITMVDVVVFVPIAFMGGIVGQVFREFGITAATATLFSLFMSFTLTPMLASRWSKSHDAELEDERKQAEHPGLYYRFTSAWERMYSAVEGMYRAILEWALGHRVAVFCLGFMTLLTSIAAIMPQPTMRELAAASVPLAAAVLLIGLLWRLPGNSQGATRWLLGLLLALPATIAILVAYGIVVMKVLHAGSPMLVVLAAILTLGTVAVTLTPIHADDAGPALVKPTKPVLIWTLAVLLVCLLGPGKFGFEFAPRTDNRQFSITVEHEVGTSLSITDATARRIEETLQDAAQYPETKTVIASVGSSSSASMMSSSVSGADTANFDVELHEIPQGDKLMARLHLRRLGSRTTDQVVQDFNKQFGHVPGVKINAALKSNMGGGSGGAPITIQVSGLDEARSLKVAARILGIVQRTEGTYGGELSWRQGRPELQAVPDDARASQYGINSATIASALRTSLEGDASVKYRENGREYDIRVSLPESQRDRTAQVPEMVVGTSSTGRPVYLADVTKLTPSVGPTKVERINRQRAVTVNAYLKDGFSLGNLRSQIDAARVSDIGADEMSGVTVEWAGTAQTMDESFGSMGAALLLAVILVFMLMSALFESVLSPLIIMLSVPQAMAGALLLMAFTGGTLSIVTMIGIIMLIGLVTKNAILMVDYTNTLRKEEGLSRGDALRKAGPTRLRPILMTTMAMIFGMLPTAIALSNGSEMRQPMAVAVIGGLTLSMFLTLLMVPVFYEIVDEFGAAIGRGIRSITGLFNK